MAQHNLHVGIIMDGNGRWAKKRKLPRSFGHRAGAGRIKDIVRVAPSFGIKCLTLYAFSTENWRRPKREISFLMRLLADQIRGNTPNLVKEGVRLRFLGDREPFSPALKQEMVAGEEATAAGEALILSMCVNYGGQDEIVRACRRFCRDVQEGKASCSRLDPKIFSRYLDTGELPPVDLIIRTSGELRISNFLIYQAAYAEFYFTPVFWPDFTPEELSAALEEFQRRRRRFGKVG